MKFTYYGHACFSVAVAGKSLLFDPDIKRAVNENLKPVFLGLHLRKLIVSNGSDVLLRLQATSLAGLVFGSTQPRRSESLYPLARS